MIIRKSVRFKMENGTRKNKCWNEEEIRRLEVLNGIQAKRRAIVRRSREILEDFRIKGSYRCES